MKQLIVTAFICLSSALAFAVGDPPRSLDSVQAQTLFVKYKDEAQVREILKGLPSGVRARDGHTLGGSTPLATNEYVDLDLITSSAVFVGTLNFTLTGQDDDHLKLIEVNFVPVQLPSSRDATKPAGN